MQFFETPELDRELREDAEYEAKEELQTAMHLIWDLMRIQGMDMRTAMEFYLENWNV